MTPLKLSAFSSRLAPAAIGLCLAVGAAAAAPLEPVQSARREGKGAAPRHAQGPGLDRIGQRRPRGTRQDRRADRRAAAARSAAKSRLIEPDPADIYRMVDTPKQIGKMVRGALHRHRHQEDPADRAHGHGLSARHAGEAAVPRRRQPRLRARHRRRQAGHRRHPAHARDPQGDEFPRLRPDHRADQRRRGSQFAGLARDAHQAAAASTTRCSPARARASNPTGCR